MATDARSGGPANDLPLQAAILSAARVLMASTGYASTTVKSVAAAAGVAPGVVTSLYANRERLVSAALRLPFEPGQAVPELIAPGLDGLGERIVRMTVSLLDDPKVRADVLRLARSDAAAGVTGDSAPSVVEQVRSLSDFLQASVVDRAVAAVGIPDARMRAALIASHLVGLTTMRYVLRLEPLASAGQEQIATLYGPSIQALLDPTVPLAPDPSGTAP